MEVELEQLGENITEKGGESLFETNSYFKKIPIIPTHKIKAFLNSLDGGGGEGGAGDAEGAGAFVPTKVGNRGSSGEGKGGVSK